jgi:hypothetical protein
MPQRVVYKGRDIQPMCEGETRFLNGLCARFRRLGEGEVEEGG